MDVALVTFAELPDLDPDDRPLVPALAARRISAAPVLWDDPAFDWGGVRMALVRSPWDYFKRFPEFLAWADRVAAATRLENPLPVLSWNLDKRYLLELAAAGLPVVPSLLLEPGEAPALAPLLEARSWRRVVVKPAVSADSWETIAIGSDEIDAGQAHLDRLLPQRAMLIQPFLESVETSGERCLVFIEGGFSHAVTKNALTRGGRWAGLPEGTAVDVAADELDTARTILSTACRLGGFPPPLYARVDLTRDAGGRPLLLELELAEPTLFLRTHAPALERLSGAIERRLTDSE